MSVRVVKEVIFVAMGDENFRQQLVFEPQETLSQFDLTMEEMKALCTGDKKKLVEMGLEENLAQYGAFLLSKRRTF
jgi:hypothetical protein